MKRVFATIVIATIQLGCQNSDPAANDKNASAVPDSTRINDSIQTLERAHLDSVNALKDQIARTIMVKPGIGIDNIIFKKSTEAEVLQYKGLSFKSMNASQYLGDDRCVFSKEYSNDSMGITFTFTSQKTYKLHTSPDSSNLSPSNISIHTSTYSDRKMNFTYLPGGKYLWESTHDDLIKEFGKPSYDFAGWTIWNKIGVSIMYSDTTSKRPYEIHLELPKK